MAAMLTGGKLLSPARSTIEIEGKYEGDPDVLAATGATETIPEDGDCDFDISGGTFAICPFVIRCLGSVHDNKTFEVKLTALSTHILPALSSIVTF